MYVVRRRWRSGRPPVATSGSTGLSHHCSRTLLNPPGSVSTGPGVTSVRSAAPIVLACTNGPCVASRKVSASGPAGPGERTGCIQPETNRRSAASGHLEPDVGRLGRGQPDEAEPLPDAERGRIGGQAVGVAAQRPVPAEQPDLQPAPGPQLPRERDRVPRVLERRVEVVEGPAPAGPGGTGARSGAAATRAGTGAVVRSGASQTQPCRSSTAHGIGRSARGGGVPCGPRDGMSTQRPSRVEAPAVRRALQPALDDRTRGQRHEAVRAPGREGAHLAVGPQPDDDERLTAGAHRHAASSPRRRTARRGTSLGIRLLP